MIVIYLYIYLFIGLFVDLLIDLFLSVYLSVHLSITLFFIYLPIVRNNRRDTMQVISGSRRCVLQGRLQGTGFNTCPLVFFYLCI